MDGIDFEPKKKYSAPVVDFVMPTMMDDEAVERPVFTLPEAMKFQPIAAPVVTTNETEVFDLDMIDGSAPIDISSY